ncbi:MAG: MFS transporter [Acidimicrobiia bacterium]|nr:MFS transporter [Acidimicrobiia bacterium]
MAALLILFGLNAVDELARTSFNVLSPNIAEYFNSGITGISVVASIAFAASLGLTVPIANLADRSNRVHLALLGGVIFAFFSGAVGLSLNIVMLAVMYSFTQMGKAFIDPAHNSLLADYYSVDIRPRVFSFHRAGNAVGGFVGPITAGFIASAWGWRAPFFVFAIPTILLVIVGTRLKEPIRGAQERRAQGASEESIATEEEPPSMSEAWRMCWKIDSLRRIYRTLPFLTPAFVGFALFGQFLYAEEFGLDEQARGIIGSIVEPFQLVGLLIGSRIGMKLFLKDPKLIFGFLGKVIFVTTAAAAVFALSPNVVVAVTVQMLISATLAFVLPGIFAALSLAIPSRARAMGFSMGSVFILPGLAMIPVIALIGEVWGIRTGMLMMTPLFLIGGLVISSAGGFIQRDIADVWKTSAARSELAYERRQGRSKLLLCRGLDVDYGDVQVLFDVDFEIDEGEVVALLGTNGAGKSTLLKSISGIVEADKGAILFDGREITHAPPNEIAPRGILQIPGGAGVFPSLTVAENLRMAGWMHRRSRRSVAAGVERVYEEFPILRRALGRARGQPVGWAAADAGARHGVPHQAAAPDDRRAVARAGPRRRRAAAPDRAEDARRGRHDHPRRAVRQHRPDPRRGGLLHGEGRDPLPRADLRAARPARRPAVGVPRGRGVGHACRVVG